MFLIEGSSPRHDVSSNGSADGGYCQAIKSAIRETRGCGRENIEHAIVLGSDVQRLVNMPITVGVVVGRR